MLIRLSKFCVFFPISPFIIYIKYSLRNLEKDIEKAAVTSEPPQEHCSLKCNIFFLIYRKKSFFLHS